MGMTRLTALVLRHRLLVVVFWLVVAVAGGLTVGTTTGRLSQSFAAPGSPAQNAADRIAAAYHVDTTTDPDVVVVTAPAGQSVDSPSSGAALRQIFAAVRPLGLLSVDVTNTRHARFTTADHRTTYAIAYLPPGGVFDASLTGRLTQAVQRATPSGQ